MSGRKEVEGAAGCIPKLGVVAFSPLCSPEPPGWANPAPRVDHLAVVSLSDREAAWRWPLVLRRGSLEEEAGEAHVHTTCHQVVLLHCVPDVKL